MFNQKLSIVDELIIISSSERIILGSILEQIKLPQCCQQFASSATVGCYLSDCFAQTQRCEGGQRHLGATLSWDFGVNVMKNLTVYLVLWLSKIHFLKQTETKIFVNAFKKQASWFISQGQTKASLFAVKVNHKVKLPLLSRFFFHSKFFIEQQYYITKNSMILVPINI